jgi:hypothetical protein
VPAVLSRVNKKSLRALRTFLHLSAGNPRIYAHFDSATAGVELVLNRGQRLRIPFIWPDTEGVCQAELVLPVFLGLGRAGRRRY